MVEVGMKKSLPVTILIFCLANVYTLSSESEFAELSPIDKVDTIIKEYYDNQWFGFRLDFAIKASLIAEEADQTLPYMLSLLKKYNTHPYESGPHEVAIIDNIIDFKLFQLNRLSESDLKELGEIYADLLDKYLKTYKKIDPMAMVLEINLIKFTRGLYTTGSLEWIERMHEKYVELGYKDLVIDYEELARVSGIK
jgi:hypothetical protein